MKNNWIQSIVFNDLKRNKAVNVTLFLFIFISALLMSTGVLVINRLSGSIEQIFEIAKPPHYLQMHIGEINQSDIASFFKQTGMVADF